MSSSNSSARVRELDDYGTYNNYFNNHLNFVDAYQFNKLEIISIMALKKGFIFRISIYIFNPNIILLVKNVLTLTVTFFS